jgi:DeoR/GlpR family transcriptional regulator of sugar metabolism
MSSIQQVITDNRIPKSDAKALEDAGIVVTVV